MTELNKGAEALPLGWLDPRNNRINHAGVAFYNNSYGEYLLKIDEEPSEKQYFLKSTGSEGDRIEYRMELVIKRQNGRFLKRQRVGHGYSDKTTSGDVFVQYGSKFKTLVLCLGDK